MIMNGDSGISSTAKTLAHSQRGVDVARDIALDQEREQQQQQQLEARLEALLGRRGYRVASAGTSLAQQQGTHAVSKAAQHLGGGDLLRSLMESVVTQCGGLVEDRRKPAVLREDKQEGSVSVAELQRELEQIREAKRKETDRAATSAALLAAQKEMEGRMRQETWDRAAAAWGDGAAAGEGDGEGEEEARRFESLKTTFHLGELPPLPTFDHASCLDEKANHAALERWTTRTRDMETFRRAGQAGHSIRTR